MGLFNRTKKADTDINDYYASERRRRVGMAWLLGLLTLVVTLVLALAIYYGGRWTYRTFIDDSSENGTTQTEDETSSNTNNGLLDTITIDDEETDTGDNDTLPANDADEETENSTTLNSSSNSIPQTGASELPSTGPSGPEELR